MKNYKALRNLTVGDGSETGPDGRHLHKTVKEGEVFQTSEEFADEHLNPLDADEAHDFEGGNAMEHRRAHHMHLVQETDEPVTAAVKVEAKKKAKLSKAEQKAADKAAKADK